MSSFKFVRLGIAAAAAALSCSLASAVTSDIAVSATVVASCTILGVPTVAFGSLDPATAATQNLTGATNGAVTFKCTKKAGVPNFDIGGSQSGTFAGAMTSATTTDTLPYTLLWTQPTANSAGYGTTVTVPVGARLLGTDYQNATPAAYAQNVTVTLTP